MEKFPKIAIVYLSYHSESYLDQLFASLQKYSYPKDYFEVIIVDNFHPEFGSSLEIIKKKLAGISENIMPKITILPQEKNLGFSGGVNVGINYAIKNGFAYVFLHNQDGFLKEDGLEKLVTVMEKDNAVGAAQSLMVLKKDPDLVNSSGNAFHYLGFGFVKNYKKNVKELTIQTVEDIGYASGAAVLIRSEALIIAGFWDEDYFFYHEDLEYSLRLRLLGFRVVAVRESIFYHDYEFGRNKNKFYYMERNRWNLLFNFYKWPTLLLLLPILLVTELGLLILALIQGWFLEKVRANFYWLNPTNIIKVFKKRSLIQKKRVKPDSELLTYATGSVNFDGAGINNPVVRFIINPILKAYFFIAKRLIRW
jgi:GT2 family glycosyltransferase